jgi:pimeloyl-ACP methyl ester carboxylesterase
VGQSLGGLIAIELAAELPGLVRSLAVVEASPSPADDPDAAAAEVAAALRRWPVPFASYEDAVAFFGGPSVAASAWASGLVERDGGWWPRFDIDEQARMLRAAVARSRWPEWERIVCPGAGRSRRAWDALPGRGAGDGRTWPRRQRGRRGRGRA